MSSRIDGLSFFSRPMVEKLRRHPKRVVFSEGEDLRVLRVASWMVELEVGVPILLGNRERILSLAKREGISMRFVNVVEPGRSSDLGLFMERFSRSERYGGVKLSNIREVLERPHYFGAMMIQYGHADGLLGGNLEAPVGFFRALSQVVKPVEAGKGVYGVAVVVGKGLGRAGDGLLFLGDCGFNAEPRAEDLARFGLGVGNLAHHFLARKVRVVFLSHSTKGSFLSASAKRVIAGVALAKEALVGDKIEVDGEMQLDVALDPLAAERKLTGEALKESPDGLIFPNLDAANISLKLFQHVMGAEVYGQFLLGLTKPAAQVPRTVTEEMLLGTALGVGVEAIKYHDLYPV